jgi:ferritin
VGQGVHENRTKLKKGQTMTKETLHNKINEQVTNEFQAAYFYLSMSSYFAAKNQPGFAHWMRVQSQEETEHALKFFDFLLKSGHQVTLLTIDQPASNFDSLLEVFSQALSNEKKVTSQIHHLADLAQQEQDEEAQKLVQWFVDEQVEEEESVSEIIEELQKVGDDANGLLALNEKLSKRDIC